MSCSSQGTSSTEPPKQPDQNVVIGVPTGEDELDFAPLEAGAELQLETFFQGGTHLTLAVRCVGLGNRAFIRVTVENVATGASVEAATPTTNPRPLICRDDYACDLLPFLVMMSGISEPEEELDGLAVEIFAEAQNEKGDSASATLRAELHTDELDAR